MYDNATMFAIDGDERAEFLKRVDPIDGKYSVSPETTSVAWRILPFYEETVKLVRVADMGWPIPHLTIAYLSHKDDLYRLNGTSPPIYEVNKRARIRLTDENVDEYVGFFFWFVRSEEGPFVMVKDLPPDLHERHQTAAKELLELALPEHPEDGRGWYFVLPVCHSGRLFSVVVQVRADGAVAMLDDQVLATDFPVGVL